MDSMDGTTACAVLGVPPSASRKQIRRAFRLLARHAHPDITGSAEEFRTLKLAHDVAFEAADDVVASSVVDEPVVDEPVVEELVAKEPAIVVPAVIADSSQATTVGTNPTVFGLSRPGSRRWLTTVATDYPATPTYTSILGQTMRHASSPREDHEGTKAKPSADFADFLEEALSGAA